MPQHKHHDQICDDPSCPYNLPSREPVYSPTWCAHCSAPILSCRCGGFPAGDTHPSLAPRPTIAQLKAKHDKELSEAVQVRIDSVLALLKDESPEIRGLILQGVRRTYHDCGGALDAGYCKVCGK